MCLPINIAFVLHNSSFIHNNLILIILFNINHLSADKELFTYQMLECEMYPYYTTTDAYGQAFAFKIIRSILGNAG